jgi:pimeloyl-ACP methyl ester carboxylesterase
MDRYVDVAPGVRLWADEDGPPESPPLLLVMGIDASAAVWPEPFLARLARHHHVLRYDHRDTGRSTGVFDEHPYAFTDLAGDAIAVLDAFGVERAHVAGISLGGMVVQLLLLDHPDRLLTATMIATSALGAGFTAKPGALGLPGPDPKLLTLGPPPDDTAGRDAVVAWRVERWRLLCGDVLPFDAEEFRLVEEKAIAHAGRHDNSLNQLRAAVTGLERGAELGKVSTPALVVEAPEDPVFPPPHSGYLADAIPSARLVTVPGMGHALSGAILGRLGTAILAHASAVPPAPERISGR